MAAKSSAVTVATTATRLDTAVEGGSAGNYEQGQPGQGLALFNNGAATVYLGGSDVTTSNGFPMPGGTYGPSVELADPGEGVYGIVAAGTVEVRVFEVGV